MSFIKIIFHLIEFRESTSFTLNCNLLFQKVSNDNKRISLKYLSTIIMSIIIALVNTSLIKNV